MRLSKYKNQKIVISEHRLITIVMGGKSIQFLPRVGDPSLRAFLSFCDCSADKSDARSLWLRVLRGEMEST